ncbi:MAG: hypothetical protein OQK29_01300 [Ignavibacteriaceae bacterium]|nr:hypothetical protein [Ignavibacteriaceae bacterium]
MNKQEIQNEIKETREKLEALEAKLKEPEKWVEKGGYYYVRTEYGDFEISGCEGQTILHCKTKKEAKDLASHLKRQAILWQLANELNDGWEPDWCDEEQDKAFIYYSHQRKKWYYSSYRGAEEASPSFNPEIAEKACEILNNQPELMS